MADVFCSVCKRRTEIIVYRAAGDIVCTDCGFNRQSRSIGYNEDWRRLADESGDKGPSRAGAVENRPLTGGSPTTVISKQRGPTGNHQTQSLGRLQNGCSRITDRSLILGFQTIATMAERLGLVKSITDRANEIFKKVEDQKIGRGRNQVAILAACLYIACRQEEKPRTVKEICLVANGATKKEIGRAKEFIVKQLKLEMGQSMEMGTIHAGDFLKRFCSNLGIKTDQILKAAEESVLKAEEIDIRRSPVSIAAAIIYVVTQLSNEKKTIKEVSVATGAAVGTVKNSFRDIYPHVPKIIPSWFAQEEDFKNLCSP